MMAMTDHAVTLADGRTLAFGEYGDPKGRPVLFLPCSPGSRRFDPDPATTAGVGVRLLTVDRPGYGASTALPDSVVPTLAALADDLAAGLLALGIERVAVIGWSAGGRSALALAARHAQRVSAVVLAGTPARDDEVPWISPEQRQMMPAMRADPRSARRQLAQMLGALAKDVDATMRLVAAAPADAKLVEDDPAARARVVAMLEEAFARGVAGVVDDIVAGEIVPRGFDLGAVVAPVVGFYGTEDPLVPPAHGEWYAGQVARGEVRRVGGGHMIPIRHFRGLLDASLA
jgi:pimeloyl-ACP methyl ester carboxylesterase